jgi:hypothetical protein
MTAEREPHFVKKTKTATVIRLDFQMAIIDCTFAMFSLWLLEAIEK